MTFNAEPCPSGRCNAAIVWARTASCHCVPVDANPSPDGNIALEFRQGVVCATVYATPVYQGHTAHRDTCVARKERSNHQ